MKNDYQRMHSCIFSLILAKCSKTQQIQLQHDLIRFIKPASNAIVERIFSLTTAIKNAPPNKTQINCWKLL